MTLPGLRGMPAGRFVRTLAREFSEHQLLDLSAQLAFYALLALFPFAIFLASLVRYVPVPDLLPTTLSLLHRVAPAEAQPLLDGAVGGVFAGARGWVLGASLAFAVVSASSGTAALMQALNRAYGVEETRSWLKTRLWAIGVTVVGAVLVIIATSALLLGPNLGQRAADLLGAGHAFSLGWRVARWPATLLAMALLLAFVYWACPNVHERWRLLTPGAVVAVPLWIGASTLLNLYVTRIGSVNRIYGALAGGVVLLMWIQISGLVVILGGEMNAIVARWRRPAPTKQIEGREGSPDRRAPEPQPA